MIACLLAAFVRYFEETGGITILAETASMICFRYQSREGRGGCLIRSLLENFSFYSAGQDCFLGSSGAYIGEINFYSGTIESGGDSSFGSRRMNLGPEVSRLTPFINIFFKYKQFGRNSHSRLSRSFTKSLSFVQMPGVPNTCFMMIVTFTITQRQKMYIHFGFSSNLLI